jgi:outer membrane protein
MKKILTVMLALVWGLSATHAQTRQWSLEECINHAIENNIQIKQQALQTQFQENAHTLAKMRLLPTLNGSASHNYSFGRALDETTYSFTENETIRSNQFFAGSNVTLFNGLQNYNNIIKTRYEVIAAEYDLERIKDNVSLSIALSYLQILLTKELIAATGAQLGITTQQIDKIGKMVDAGSLARGNLFDIQAQAAREELQLINLQNQLDLSILNMTQLLELSSPDGFDIVTPAIDIEPAAIAGGNVTDIFDTAVGTRPEIKGAETRLDIAGIDIKIAKAGLMPRLTLNSSFSTGYSDIRRKLLGIDPLTGPIYGDYSFADQLNDNINYGLGFSLSIPIFNGWQVRTNIKNSQIQQQNSQFQLENSRKQLFKDIQQASADAVAALKKYAASEKAVEATQESFRYSEQRFNVGLVTPVEYNASKTQLLNSQSDLLQSKYEYVFKIKVLDFYQGIPIKL